MRMREEIYTTERERQEDHLTPESRNADATQRWEKYLSPKQQNTRGMRTMEYNGTGQKSYTKKKTESLGN
jgi:hypothetical protein